MARPYWEESREEPKARRPIDGADTPGSVLIDVRGFTPSLVSGVLLGFIDLVVSLGSTDEMIIVVDHEPTGLELQLDLRRETRGLFRYRSEQRRDGAWVESIRRRI